MRFTFALSILLSWYTLHVTQSRGLVDLHFLFLCPWSHPKLFATLKLYAEHISGSTHVCLSYNYTIIVCLSLSLYSSSSSVNLNKLCPPLEKIFFLYKKKDMLDKSKFNVSYQTYLLTSPFFFQINSWFLSTWDGLT